MRKKRFIGRMCLLLSVMNGNILKTMLVLLTVFAFSGCALLQPIDPFRVVETQIPLRSERQAGVPSAREPEGPLELPQAIEIALANNPDIATRRWEVTQAEAQKDGSLGARWPSIRATGSYNYYYFDAQRLIPTRENSEPGVFSHNISSADLVLSMPLFTGGQITNRIEASELFRIAAEQIGRAHV